MSVHYGDVPVDSTIYHMFGSYDGGTGASITLTGLAVGDIKIYKNGGTTQRSSTNGFTLLDTDGIDFDAITGIHGFSIDLSDNSDAGFYAAGNWYNVIIDAVTIDGQTVSFPACSFTIEMAGGAIETLAANVPDTLSLANINAEVVDVLKTDTIAEMAQQAPPATPTFEEAVMYLYMAFRNKIDITATLKEFHNDAGTVIAKKTLSDDGTTYSEAEAVTGP